LLVLVVLVELLLAVTEQMVRILEFLVLHHSPLFGQLVVAVVDIMVALEEVVVYQVVLVAAVVEILMDHWVD
jgi:hypothetical protein